MATTGPLTFDHLAAWYLDDYLVRRLRTVDTARGRVANLRATFGGRPATVIMLTSDTASTSVAFEFVPGEVAFSGSAD